VYVDIERGLKEVINRKGREEEDAGERKGVVSLRPLRKHFASFAVKYSDTTLFRCAL
jgi:hypothetical protein